MRIKLSLDKGMMTRVLVIDVMSELPVPPARVRVAAYTNLGDVRCRGIVRAAAGYRTWPRQLPGSF
jgi:hypothetical protein